MILVISKTFSTKNKTAIWYLERQNEVSRDDVFGLVDLEY